MRDVAAPPRTGAVVLYGNPNTGKSTLFSALTGTRQKTANFPGVTVEARLGRCPVGEGEALQLIDLPGAYSLAARSPDEQIATDALLGRLPGIPAPDGVLIVVDASNLDRNLYLATQLLEFGRPAVVALTMVDVARRAGITVDAERLSAELGVPVVPIDAPRKQGLDALRTALVGALARTDIAPLELPYPEALTDAVDRLHAALGAAAEALGVTATRPEALRLLVDPTGPWNDRALAAGGPSLVALRDQLRAQVGPQPAAVETQARYRAIGAWTAACRTRDQTVGPGIGDRVDRILTHRLWGSLVLLAVLGLVFQSIFAWSGPAMDAIEGLFGSVGEWVLARMAPGPLRSLIVDGVIAGVGGVLVFLPQILILFAFIALLEDVGYMARAAFLMDRLMSRFGLSGRSFLPMLSSFACAIPGVMGARTISDRRTRLTTIFLAPFMSCSARLPVYHVMIAAFVPAATVLGGFQVQALVMLGMYLVGIAAAMLTALILQRGIFKHQASPFLLELPPYRRPRVGAIGRTLVDRGGAFVRRAGTLILAASIVVWALGYFPRQPETLARFAAARAAAERARAADVDRVASGFRPGLAAEGVEADPQLGPAVSELQRLAEAEEGAAGPAEAELAARHGRALAPAREIVAREAALAETLAGLDAEQAGELTRASWLGRMGRGIEPVVRPLGWDWRIGMAAIASFPAREVIIATLGTIFNLGSEQDEESQTLRETLKSARDIDGEPLFTLATGLSIMVFFALCAQCAATLAVMKRETNSWRWPIASFLWMTALAYVAALVTFQIARAMGG